MVMATDTKHVCMVCGYIFEEDVHGSWENLDEDFLCPDCLAEKDMFEEQKLSK